MAHVVYANYPPSTSVPGGHAANQWWMLTRALIKAGWRYMASGGDAAKDATRDPRNDKFAIGGWTSTGNNGTGATIGAKTGEDVLITGLTGMVSPSSANSNKGGSEGNFLVLSGCASAANNTVFQITEVVSATSVRARTVVNLNAAVASDANSGSITWTEYDPLQQVYTTTLSNNYKWICLRGASVLKMAFTASPTGTFLRGEKVTQGTAEGELVGITWDPDTGSGWAVIMHRQTGSGGAARGWATASAVTGSSSSATFTPTGVTEYVEEVVFADGHQTAAIRAQGTLSAWMTMCALDGGTEEAMLPSTLAGAGGLGGAAGCTATVHPGGGGTGNAFPTIGMGFAGRPEQTSNGNYQHMSSYDSNGQPPGFAHISAANCIGRAGQSPDGNFWIIFGVPTVGPYCFPGLMHVRFDDTEEGDVWLWGAKAGGAMYHGANFLTDSTSRYMPTVSVASGGDHWVPFSDYSDSNTAPAWSGWNTWRARGMVSGASGTYTSTVDRYLPTVGLLPYAHRVAQGMGSNTNDPDTVKAAATPTLVRDHPIAAAYWSGYKYRKGRARWLAYVNGSPQAGDTLAGKQWVCARDIGVNNPQYLAPILGPWDGTSTPLVG